MRRAPGQPSHLRRWCWARRAVAAAFLVLLILGSFDWFPWFKGSMTATSLLGIVPFTDPLAALEVTLATRSWHGSMLTGAFLLIASGALLGPLFCGWVCPLGLVLDVNDAVRRRLLRWTTRGREDRRRSGLPSGTRYVLLGATLGFSLVAQLPAFQVLSPINILAWGVIFAPGLGLLAVFGIALVEYVFPRLWCRALCPLGALYSLVGRYGLFRVQVNPAQAGKNPCGMCSPRCPMGIRVMEEYTMPRRPTIDHLDCTRCGECIDACPHGVLRFGFGGGSDHNEKANAAQPGRHAPQLERFGSLVEQHPAEPGEEGSRPR